MKKQKGYIYQPGLTSVGWFVSKTKESLGKPINEDEAVRLLKTKKYKLI